MKISDTDAGRAFFQGEFFSGWSGGRFPEWVGEQISSGDRFPGADLLGLGGGQISRGGGCRLGGGALFRGRDFRGWGADFLES